MGAVEKPSKSSLENNKGANNYWATMYLEAEIPKNKWWLKNEDLLSRLAWWYTFVMPSSLGSWGRRIKLLGQNLLHIENLSENCKTWKSPSQRMTVTLIILNFKGKGRKLATVLVKATWTYLFECSSFSI